MGKKKSNNQGEQKNNGNGDGGKKDNNGIGVVVLKLDLPCECEGCTSKVMRCIRGFDGIESVKGVDGDLSKVTVIGNVDPEELRQKVEQKINKKVELVSPPAKKAKENAKNKDGDGEANKKKTEEKPVKQSEEKKSKEPPVTTVVMKVHLHCEGCIQKIYRAVSKTKGYLEMSIDRPKDLVTVKGAIDGKLLAESLKERLKRPVEIVQPKKEGGGGEKGKGGGGGGGGGEKGKGGAGGGGKADGGDNVGDGVLKFDEHRMEYGDIPYPYPYAHPYPPVYGSGYVPHAPHPYPPVYGSGHVPHAPQMFSDENPNACSVM